MYNFLESFASCELLSQDKWSICKTVHQILVLGHGVQSQDKGSTILETHNYFQLTFSMFPLNQMKEQEQVG